LITSSLYQNKKGVFSLENVKLSTVIVLVLFDVQWGEEHASDKASS